VVVPNSELFNNPDRSRSREKRAAETARRLSKSPQSDPVEASSCSPSSSVSSPAARGRLRGNVDVNPRRDLGGQHSPVRVIRLPVVVSLDLHPIKHAHDPSTRIARVTPHSPALRMSEAQCLHLPDAAGALGVTAEGPKSGRVGMLDRVKVEQRQQNKEAGSQYRLSAGTQVRGFTSNIARSLPRQWPKRQSRRERPSTGSLWGSCLCLEPVSAARFSARTYGHGIVEQLPEFGPPQGHLSPSSTEVTLNCPSRCPIRRHPWRSRSPTLMCRSRRT